MATTLSRAQRLQIITLVITTTVCGEMFDEVRGLINVNANRTRKRIVARAEKMLKAFPVYDKDMLDMMMKHVCMVWNEQDKKGYDAVTMLTLALALVEDIRMAWRAGGRRASYYADWTRLAGSLFTLCKHVRTQWEDPYDATQLMAMDLYGKLIRAIYE